VQVSSINNMNENFNLLNPHFLFNSHPFAAFQNATQNAKAKKTASFSSLFCFGV